MSELIDVLLPADQVEGTRSQVQRWLKAVGQSARRHEPLVEIETDKVTVEVPSPADGVLEEIVVAEGVDVAPGALLGRLRAGASAAAHPAAAVATRTARRSRRGPRRATSAAQPAGRMSPAVRRLLAERGLNAESIQGSGEGGRITVEDVLAAKPQAVPAAPATAVPAPRRRRGAPRARTRRCAGELRRTWSRACCAPRRT